ncbi:MAG: chemotaxis protein CheW [Lachnospiraceae bacterium]|nr:chemotaxis protein CheW [Lachnospiraceae bacterium]MBR4808403.1 chemotaxis protein CheW [Lachnospiraceae bacterium]
MEENTSRRKIGTEVTTKQYIVVNIGSERYGIDITYIDNIVRMQKITRVPKAQDYFKGVINLRGEVVPVMSVRLRMGLEPDEYTNASRIIIIKLEQQGSIGLIVDEVQEVVTLDQNEIDRISRDNGSSDRISFINGIGKHDGQLISLLELQSVVAEKAVQ